MSPLNTLQLFTYPVKSYSSVDLGVSTPRNATSEHIFAIHLQGFWRGFLSTPSNQEFFGAAEGVK